MAPVLTGMVSAEEMGRRIYEEGVLMGGRSLMGTVQGDVALHAAQVVCANCHRRSGLGSSEGGIVVPPVTGDKLFQPVAIARPELYGERTEGEGTRPAYTAQTLARAIREGIDAAGRPLGPLMPRFHLDDDSMAALTAHLRSLDSTQAPGVTAETIHFATVTSDRIAPDSETALLELLERFFEAKNAETRRESRRAATPPWHKDKIYTAYRAWRLHHWRLTGPVETWPDQLAAFYRRQPVFALLSGSVGAPWRPIHRFAEANGIPTLFPHTGQPENGGYYTFYTSEGEALRARAIARDLETHPVRRVVQVYLGGGAGEAGASALRAQWRGGAALVDLVIDYGMAPPAFALDAEDAVVWWLDETAVTLAPLPEGTPALLYLAGGGPTLPGTLPFAAEKVIAVHPYRFATSLETGMRPLLKWFEMRGIESPDPHLMADAFLAVTATGEALMHINTHFSRHYFIEKLEHGLSRSTFSGPYPVLSSAPGQRFVAKGSYMLELDGNARPVRQNWVVP